jgi:hypothetical protein
MISRYPCLNSSNVTDVKSVYHLLAFNLKSLNNNASALIEARGQSASAGVRSALENVQDLHYYAESPLGHVMRYVLALTSSFGVICQTTTVKISDKIIVYFCFSSC